MERDALASSVVLGLIAGAVSTLSVDTFIYYFVLPELTYPPLSLWIGWTGLSVIVALMVLCISTVSGMLFSYSHQSRDLHVPIRQVFRYGIAQPLPYILLGLALAPFLNPFYLTVYYVIVFVLPIFVFGLVFVLTWNVKWGP
jgi:hypothetical protein